MAQGGRYELKYVIDEDRARAITHFVRTHLRPTRYNRWGPVPGQPTISLYLDSPDFLLFRQNCHGLKNRFKLRIRFYDNEWRHPAFLEIKRRLSDVICKSRALISREGVRRLLEEGWPRPSHWPEQSALVDTLRLDTYFMFWSLCNRLRAQGMLYVSYLREAYDSPVNSTLRVTLDRQISASVYDGSGRLTMPSRGVRPSKYEPHWLPPDCVVLEMKFDDRAPTWMLDMARVFNLQRRPVSKYCACVDALGLSQGGRVLPEQEVRLMLDAAR
jgi:hypothetical protein